MLTTVRATGDVRLFSASNSADNQNMSRTALVVDSDPAQLSAAAQRLEALGYSVITASTFDDARRDLLTIDALSLLVADVRLGQFNGLHLAFRARARHPNVRVVITDRVFDAALQAETNRLSGAYLPRPFTPDAFASAVGPAEPDPTPPKSTRRWPRKQMANTVRAAVGPREARVLDISYGGMRLAFLDGELDDELPSTLDVELTALGLSLKMHPVWARNDDASLATLCGGEVVEHDQPALSQWREFVDSYVGA